MLDVMIAVGHSLDEKSKERLVDLGLTLRPVPTRQKRGSFSGLPKASKHRHKEHIVTLLKDYTSEIISLSYKNIFISLCDVWGHQMDTLKLWGIELKTELIPAEMRVANVIAEQNVAHLNHTVTEHKVAKVCLVADAVNSLSSSKGCARSLSQEFGISRGYAAKILNESVQKKSVTEILKKNSRLSISDTEWPKVVADFCLDKPICREAPGETVSISYGERAEKYIRQFSVEEIYNFFMIKYPDFPRKLTVFRTLIPKNLVAPTLRDVKGNICPLHENVTRAIRAFNRFSQKNKVKDLSLPKSTIDICLKIICNPFPNDPKENRNPLNWDVKCTTGVCELCGLRDWLMSLSKTITDKKDGLEKKKITFSNWVRALGSDGKKSRF